MSKIEEVTDIIFNSKWFYSNNKEHARIIAKQICQLFEIPELPLLSDEEIRDERNSHNDAFYTAREFNAEKESPYMLLVANVRNNKLLPLKAKTQMLKGLDKLKVKRSVIPAITHVDNSARIQTVDPQRHPKLHRLMKRFKEKTGCPVIINTSFNIRGEPIVCSPEDAYRCFMATNMDVLVMENQLLYKQEQPQAKQHEIDAYLAQFELD